ncbi:hypothetical protein OH76DRAFT_276190 [Lentinus brumalis]|uniref:Uncharacterized protein n=1 Tax=Lentinus brumalis TaxID=2498619 RepID=A0A371CL29_9APHY|nr:hypothetical protein OH76DRAFT_276190 [Polyporus brumalis]
MRQSSLHARHCPTYRTTQAVPFAISQNALRIRPVFANKHRTQACRPPCFRLQIASHGRDARHLRPRAGPSITARLRRVRFDEREPSAATRTIRIASGRLESGFRFPSPACQSPACPRPTVAADWPDSAYDECPVYAGGAYMALHLLRRCVRAGASITATAPSAYGFYGCMETLSSFRNKAPAPTSDPSPAVLVHHTAPRSPTKSEVPASVPRSGSLASVTDSNPSGFGIRYSTTVTAHPLWPAFPARQCHRRSNLTSNANSKRTIPGFLHTRWHHTSQGRRAPVGRRCAHSERIFDGICVMPRLREFTCQDFDSVSPSVHCHW